MIRITLTSALIALGAWAAQAQQGVPGSHFIENWDLDGDGQVTLAEATERRGDVFVTFDSDDDGVLTPEEYDVFDEARANDIAENGMGRGLGYGQGRFNPANGMLREFTDADGDGHATQAEFMAAVPDWYARVDRNGDGTVTLDDFARGGN